MTDRETALSSAQYLYGSDADVVRRADLFYRFLADTPAAVMSIHFGNLMDPITQQLAGGIVPIVNGRVQLRTDQGFVFSAIASDIQGAMMSQFTSAADDPDVADIQPYNSDGKSFFVTPTIAGSTVITVSDANFSLSFALDIVAA